jgi:peptidoglycan hydrolase-like protein with peptidoglycan-binding domain
MSNGRSAWSTTGHSNGSNIYEYISGKPQDGSEISKGDAYRAVNLGVKAIQTAINSLGFNPPLVADGVLGPKSADGIKWAQSKLGLRSDGKAGSGTCTALWRSYIAIAAARYGVDPKYLFGQIAQESGYDPGAVGYSNDHDHGLVQINLDTYPDVTWEQAHDPAFATDWSAKRMAAAMKKYSGKGTVLQTNCTILQHNSPANADKLFDTGNYPNSTSKTYVSNILSYAQKW